MAMVLVLIFTPVTIKVAHFLGAMDQPDARKVHRKPTPRLGGIAISLSTILTLGFLWFWDHGVAEAISSRSEMVIGIGIGFTIVLILGIFDDIYSLTAGSKFLIQTIAATIVVVSGLSISALTNPLTDSVIELGWVSIPLSILWILAITNALNLIDGLDGLAAGVGAIAALTISAISVMYAHYTVAVIMIVISGALVGFLKFNFSPARIFLGDSGSLLLGFALALGAMQASVKSPAVFTLIVGIAILALPILDTSVAMLRRFIKPWIPVENQEHPLSLRERIKSIFLPDKSHIHHRLLAKGWSQRKSVMILYLISIIFGFCAILLSWSDSFNITFLLITFALLYTWSIIRNLDYNEIAIFSNGLLLHLFFAPLAHRKVWQHSIDALAFASAMFLSWYLLAPEVSFIVIGIVTALQFGVFKGLRYFYHEPYKNIGLGDTLSLLKSVSLSIFAGWIVFVASTGLLNGGTVALFALGFYLAITMLLISRVGFDILNYLSRKNRSEDKKVIIYGTGSAGMLALSQLLEQEGSKASPLGFLDDNPERQGCYMNGFPVFGGHWKLARLIKTHNIDEIVIAEPNILPDIVARLEALAMQNNIALRVLHWQLQRLPFTNTSVGLNHSASSG